MIEHQDDLNIEINLRIICESNDKYEFHLTDFVDKHNRQLSSKYVSEKFASLMEREGLIRISGDFCSVEKFGIKVFNSGGWLKYLSNQEKQETEIELSTKEKENLVLENLKLQNEAAEYQKSIRGLESQNRNLTRDNLRLENWDIRFRWYIAIGSFIVGFVLEFIMGK